MTSDRCLCGHGRLAHYKNGSVWHCSGITAILNEGTQIEDYEHNCDCDQWRRSA